jgi:hypothetical protein
VFKNYIIFSVLVGAITSVFGRLKIAVKTPSLGRGAIGCEVAGRGFAINTLTTTYVFNFVKL